MAGRTTRKMNRGEQGGFTIIEVVLVLAIAGLIFLMVFIALPGLQRAQRDTERRQAMANLQSKIMDYQNNNNGKLPSDGKVDAVEDADGVAIEEKWDCRDNSASKEEKSAICFIRNYLNSVNATENQFKDPRGWAYGLTIETLGKNDEKTLTTEDFEEHMVYIVKKAKCDGEKAVSSNNSRDYAIMIKLEGSGTYCQDNSD